MAQETRNKRAAAWNHIAANECFTVNDIAMVIAESTEKGREIVKEFERRGVIQQVAGIGVAGRPKIYARIEGQEPVLGRGHCGEGRVVRRRDHKTKQQKMWNAMKMHKQFTRIDLQMTAEVTDSHAKSFLSALYKAGYIRFLVKVKAGIQNKGKLSRYTLLRNTGQLAPLVRKTGIWDQNEQRFYPFATTGGIES
ncbi:hypothetical protein ACB316_08430 [Aeromonas sanarellii]